MTQAFGRPINGEISPTTPPTPQAPEAQFIEALDRLLDVEGVTSVRWEGYTPYFNDGDACEYGVNEASVSLDFGDEEGGEMDDGFYSEWDLYEFGEGDTWEERYRNRTHTVNGKDAAHVSKALKEFNKTLTGGQHNELLKRLFGDHAQVTATREGFDVEFYDHE